MEDMNHTNIAETLGSSVAGAMGAFESSIESNKAAALEKIRTCENNAGTYRSLLESDCYTFEQKREIKGWLDDEKRQQEAIDEKRHERDQDTLGKIVFLGCAAVIGIVALRDTAAAKKMAKDLWAMLPKFTKGV